MRGETCSECAATPTVGQGLCGKHYSRWHYQRGHRYEFRRPRCGVEECERPKYVPSRRPIDNNPGYCERHWERWAKNGNPLDATRNKKQYPKPRLVSISDYTSPTLLGKALGVTRQRANQLLNPNANRARHVVDQALKSGTIIKPSSCVRCDKHTDDLEAHHWDYREQLDVRWLCVPCHNIVHPHGNSTGRLVLEEAVPRG